MYSKLCQPKSYIVIVYLVVCLKTITTPCLYTFSYKHIPIPFSPWWCCTLYISDIIFSSFHNYIWPTKCPNINSIDSFLFLFCSIILVGSSYVFCVVLYIIDIVVYRIYDYMFVQTLQLDTHNKTYRYMTITVHNIQVYIFSWSVHIFPNEFSPKIEPSKEHIISNVYEWGGGVRRTGRMNGWMDGRKEWDSSIIMYIYDRKE